MSAVLPDPSTPFGERVARRLRDEPIIWLTIVGADGTPQPNPVWFLWDGESFLIYSLKSAKRLGHIQRSAKVSLHFDGNGTGVTSSSSMARCRYVPRSPRPTRMPPMWRSTRISSLGLSRRRSVLRRSIRCLCGCALRGFAGTERLRPAYGITSGKRPHTTRNSCVSTVAQIRAAGHHSQGPWHHQARGPQTSRPS